jgi:hypothetical protein
MQCSPYHNQFYKKHKTCFTKAQLIDIATHMNLTFNKSKSTVQVLWDQINERMSKECSKGDETCWVDKMDKHFNAHLPRQPREWKQNPHTWLTNIDILNVMTQYEKKYKKFKFIGVFPIDFNEKYGLSQCISAEICNLKLSKFKNQNAFACVFNLDKHYQSGSHWVAVFFNTRKTSKNYGFYFFDSTSSKMPVEIHNFGNSIKNQINDTDFQLYQNNVIKQFQNTECGMFCLHFIIECLKNKSFNQIINDETYDEQVHKLRNKLFRKH